MPECTSIDRRARDPVQIYAAWQQKPTFHNQGKDSMGELHHTRCKSGTGDFFQDTILYKSKQLP